MPSQGFDGVVNCRVLALEPLTLLRISWANESLDTTVTWTLEAEGTGTRLFLIHAGFDGTDPQQQTVMRILGGGGGVICTVDSSPCSNSWNKRHLGLGHILGIFSRRFGTITLYSSSEPVVESEQVEAFFATTTPSSPTRQRKGN